MMIEGLWVVYKTNVAPVVYTAQLYTIGPSGLKSENCLFTNTDLEALRSQIPPGSHRMVVTGPTVTAGNTLLEIWV